MLQLDAQEISSNQIYANLTNIVSPRPIALVSTMDENGNANLAPFSFFNMISANPPLLMVSPLLQADLSQKHTLQNIENNGELVINVVNFSMAEQISLASADFEKGISEFEKVGFTKQNSDTVKPFRVQESPVQIECVKKEILKFGNEANSGNLIICEVKKIHISKDVLNEKNRIDQHKLDLVARAGENKYVRAKEAFFEIKRPSKIPFYTFDTLPKDIVESEIFTSNQKAQLCNIDVLPTEEEIQQFKTENPDFQNFDTHSKQLKAQEFLLKNQVENAWKLLLG